MPVTHQTAIFGFNFERHSVGPDRRLTGSALALSHSQTRAAASWVQVALGVEPGSPCRKGRTQQELSWEHGEGLEGLVQGSCGRPLSCQTSWRRNMAAVSVLSMLVQ